MQATIALFILKKVAGYLWKHPQIIEKAATKAAHAIPGTIDDKVVAFMIDLYEA